LNRLERLIVLLVLALVALGLVALRPLPAVLGAAAGIAGGLSVAGSIGRLRTKVEARLGPDEPVPARGVRRDVLVWRLGTMLAVLVGLWVLTWFIPFAGERAYAAMAAAATAFPAVLTAQRLLPRRAAKP
jgi:hypothetical protein